MADKVMLNRTQFERIANAVLHVERTGHRRGIPARSPINTAGSPNYIAMSPSAGIPAISGMTPGTAMVAIYALDGSGVLTATGDSLPAYNMAPWAVGGSRLVMLKWAGGGLFVDWETCPTS